MLPFFPFASTLAIGRVCPFTPTCSRHAQSTGRKAAGARGRRQGSYLPALFPPSSLPSKSRGPTPSLSHSLSPSLRASKRGHPYCLGSQPQAHEVDGHVGARVVRREPEEEHVESTELAKVLWQRDLPESQSPYFEQTNGGVRIFCVRRV